jgi:hypothetical protein
MKMVGDLSTLAEQLRKEGFHARNLAQVGITIWDGAQGFFISAEELRELPHHITARDFRQVLEERKADGRS